jgi:hypothetical protein
MYVKEDNATPPNLSNSTVADSNESKMYEIPKKSNNGYKNHQ